MAAATASNENRVLAEPLDFISSDDIVFDAPRRSLGAGGFGSVERGTWTGIPVAIKSIPLLNADAEHAIVREVQIQQRLRDPRVCAVYGVFRKNNSDEVCIVMELAATSLHAKLHDPKTSRADKFREFPMRARLTLLWQIAGVLGRMHAGDKAVWEDGETSNASFIHCDLKPHNILLMSDGTPKLADFGLSTIRHADTGQTVIGARRGQGTAEYLCPTLIRITDHGGNESQSPAPYTAATDMYAFGIIVYEVLTGFRPYHALFDGMVARRAAGRGGGDAISPAEWSGAVMSAVMIGGQRPMAAEVLESCVDRGLNPGLAGEIKAKMEACWDSEASKRPSAREMAYVLKFVLDASAV